MGLFGRIRLDLRKQRAEIATEEEGLAHTGLSAERVGNSVPCRAGYRRLTCNDPNFPLSGLTEQRISKL